MVHCNLTSLGQEKCLSALLGREYSTNYLESRDFVPGFQFKVSFRILHWRKLTATDRLGSSYEVPLHWYGDTGIVEKV